MDLPSTIEALESQYIDGSRPLQNLIRFRPSVYTVELFN
jgi:hypothetical protein